MRRVSGLFLLLAAAAMHAAPPQPVILWRIPADVVTRSAHIVPSSNAERLALLRGYFEAAECRDSSLKDATLPDSKRKNLVCTMEGTTDRVIVIAAHYELEGKGAAAIDDWSGALMLPLIFRALHATVPHHTFIFAEFAGHQGAQTFLKSLSKKQRDGIVCMVGLDALGVGSLQFWASPHDGAAMAEREWMIGATLADAANTLHMAKLPDMGKVWAALKVDDTQEFHRASIPSVLIHSIQWENRFALDAQHDTADAIDGKAYYEAYRLLSTYCAQLDRTLDKGLAEQDSREKLALRTPKLR